MRGCVFIPAIFQVSNSRLERFRLRLRYLSRPQAVADIVYNS